MKLPEEEHLRAFAASLGGEEILPTVEADPKAVWLTEDDAPGGAAGYYRKDHLPAPHRILQDGRTAAFEFRYRQVWYRIQLSHRPTYIENLIRVVEVLDTLVRWDDEGVLAMKDLLEPFRRTIHGDEWWRVLRVPPDATAEEIEEGYRRQAWKIHPDRGGTHEAFLRLQAAYTEARSNAHRG